MLILLSLVGTGVLGYPILARTLYPSDELVRQVRVTDFLDRMDLFYVGIWLPTMMTKIAYSLYLVCHGLNRVAPNLSLRPSLRAIRSRVALRDHAAAAGTKSVGAACAGLHSALQAVEHLLPGHLVKAQRLNGPETHSGNNPRYDGFYHR